MTAMLNVGVSPQAINEARIAINEILLSDNDQDTKRTALACLSQLCEVKNTTIQNNTFTAKK